MIKKGDFVNVFFESVEHEFGIKVLYVPSATGDSWHLERKDGTIVYIQTFTKMIKCKN